MRNRLGSPTSFTLDDLVQAIRNGYEYISNILNKKLGRIEKGYRADMITVPYIAPTPVHESNIIGHLFFGVFDNFHPRDVYVSGKCLLRDYKSSFDLKEAFKNSRIEAAEVWKRLSV
jgi:cytosine/adenosine deaminase-related metal-dependent hydrolase